MRTEITYMDKDDQEQYEGLFADLTQLGLIPQGARLNGITQYFELVMLGLVPSEGAYLGASLRVFGPDGENGAPVYMLWIVTDAAWKYTIADTPIKNFSEIHRYTGLVKPRAHYYLPEGNKYELRTTFTLDLSEYAAA